MGAKVAYQNIIQDWQLSQLFTPKTIEILYESYFLISFLKAKASEKQTFFKCLIHHITLDSMGVATGGGNTLPLSKSGGTSPALFKVKNGRFFIMWYECSIVEDNHSNEGSLNSIFGAYFTFLNDSHLLTIQPCLLKGNLENQYFILILG